MGLQAPPNEAVIWGGQIGVPRGAVWGGQGVGCAPPHLSRCGYKSRSWSELGDGSDGDPPGEGDDQMDIPPPMPRDPPQFADRQMGTPMARGPPRLCRDRWL